MTRRQIFFTTLAGLHLLLVGFAAAGINVLPEEGIFGKTTRAARNMMGSDNRFGFFAPAVGAELRARFTLIDADGHAWHDTLDLGNNPEARLRVGNVVSLLYFDELRRPVAKSLAAAMFGRHPTAQQIIVDALIFDPPTMEEYRSGERPQWQVFYSASFVRTTDSSTTER